MSLSSAHNVFHQEEVEDHSSACNSVFSNKPCLIFPSVYRHRIHLYALDYCIACRSYLPWMHNVESLPAIRTLCSFVSGTPTLLLFTSIKSWQLNASWSVPMLIHQGNYQMCLCIQTRAHMHKHMTNKNAATALCTLKALSLWLMQQSSNKNKLMSSKDCANVFTRFSICINHVHLKVLAVIFQSTK